MGSSPTFGHLHDDTANAPRRRVLRLCWELVAATRRRAADPLIELRRKDVLGALDVVKASVPGVDVRVAALVELWDTPDHNLMRLCASLKKTARVLREHGIGFDIWPQLEDHGRFLNTRTARTYSERLLPVLETMRNEHNVGLFLDMEPPLETLESAWSLQGGDGAAARVQSLGRLVKGVVGAVKDARQGMRDLAELARDIAGVGLPVLAAVPPPVFALDSFGAETVKRFVLGCPDGDDEGASLFGTTAALCYTPLLRRRGADRAQQHRILSLWAARHRERSSAICLGPLSTGLLGDEPCYLSRDHFADDLKAIVALGYDDVTLYSGEGLLFGERGEPNDGVRADLADWAEVLALFAPASSLSSTSTSQAA